MAAIGLSYRKYMAVLALQIVLVMTVLDVTVVNVALPVLADEFNISNSSSVWIITVYQLVITMLLLPVSSIGDLHSYKRTFLTGVVIFTAASVLCAAAQNFTMIVVARAIQLNAVRLCLYISIGFAFCAGIFSYTRTLGHKSELHM